jgi:hypothetical protein
MSFLIQSVQPRSVIRRSVIRRGLAAIAAASCLVAAVPHLVAARSLPGFTLWGGPGPERELRYFLQYGNSRVPYDRYRLRIPRQNLAINQIVVDYPVHFDGGFNPDSIEVRYKSNNESIPLKEVNWDPDSYVVEMFPEEPIPAGENLEIVMSNVRPPDPGMYNFNCKILSPGDQPLLRYIGTWVLSID